MPYWSPRGSDPEPTSGHAADPVAGSNSNTGSLVVAAAAAAEAAAVVLCDQRALAERTGKNALSLWAGGAGEYWWPILC